MLDTSKKMYLVALDNYACTFKRINATLLKPSVLFMEHLVNSTEPDQTLQRFYTVCSQNVLLKFEWNWNILSNNPSIWNEFVQFIKVGNSIRHKWINLCWLELLFNERVHVSFLRWLNADFNVHCVYLSLFLKKWKEMKNKQTIESITACKWPFNKK